MFKNLLRLMYDVTRHRATSRLIARYLLTSRATIVRRRKTSSMIERHRTTVIRSTYDIVEVARPSYDVVRFTYDLSSHQATIVKSYVIVRLSFDCRTMSYELPTITQTLPMCHVAAELFKFKGEGPISETLQ